MSRRRCEQSIWYKHLRKAHPDNTIVAVLNFMPRSGVRFILQNIAEGFVADCMYRGLFGEFLKKEKRMWGDIHAIQKDPNAILVSPPIGESVLPFATNKENLLRLYWAGREAAKNILKKLKCGR